MEYLYYDFTKSLKQESKLQYQYNCANLIQFELSY